MEWIPIGGAGVAGAAGATGPSGSAGTPAPEVVSSTVAVIYGLRGNDSVCGFSGTMTLPTAHVDYAHLTWIQIDALISGSVLPVPIATVPGHTAAWTSPPNDLPLLMKVGTQSWTLRFTAINEAGAPSPAPYVSGAVTVAASLVTGFTSAADSAVRTVDNSIARQVLTRIDFVPILSGGVVPQNVTYWLPSAKDITKFVWVGWKVMPSVGATISVNRLVPAVAATWVMYCAAGPIGGDPSVELSAAQVIALGGVASSGFAVATVATPAANVVTAASVGAAVNKLDADGTQYAEIPGGVYIDPPVATDTNFFVRITMEQFNAANVSIAAEKEHGGTMIVGGTHTLEAFPTVYGGGLAYVRYRLYVANRNSQTTGDFTNTTTNTKQTTCWSGADHYDVTITTPSGKLKADRLDPATVGTGLTLTAAGVKFATSNLSDMLMNPGFEDGVNGTTNIPHWTGTGAYSLLTNPVAYSGANVLYLNGSASVFGEAISVRPGDQLYVEAYVQFQYVSGSPTGALDVILETRDAAGVLVGSPSYIPVTGYANATAAGVLNTWTRIKANATVPAGVSSIRVWISTSSIAGVGAAFFVDNVLVSRQVPTGPGTEMDGFGGVKAKMTGPLYTDIANNIDIRLAGDFVVTTGPTPTLSQYSVDLGKAVGFSTAEFDGGLGVGLLIIKALAVTKLVAGNALFTGQATFAYKSTLGVEGGIVTISAAGITLAEKITSPTATVTIASAGISIVKGSTSVQIAAASITFADSNSNVLTMSSGGIIASKGTKSVQITASNISITDGVGTVVLSGTDITISRGGSASVVITAAAVTINDGKLTLNSGGVTTEITNAAAGALGGSAAGFHSKLNGTATEVFLAAGQMLMLTSTSNFSCSAGTCSGSITGSGGFLIAGGAVWQMTNLPTASPGAGSKRFWYDTATNNVKYAP